MMGQAFRTLRHRRGLKQLELSQLSGCTGACISKTEYAHSLPKLRGWLRLAQILCEEQDEYDELRGYFLGTLEADDADYEFLPRNIKNLKAIDTYSSEIPSGVLGAIKTVRHQSEVECHMEQEPEQTSFL